MKKVAVFMLFGQSNAVGHASPMSPCDVIQYPLKNVFGLHRDQNQTFDNEKLVFSGYTSHGMNLAETQDNTYSIANCLAKRWQDAIDSGKKLPDLYIVHIAIGSQGVFGMWSPDRKKVIKPGILGACNVSMYPLAIHVITLMHKYFKENSLTPQYFGIHWRGGEQEIRREMDELTQRLKADYLRIFGGIRAALGEDAPIVIHRFPFASFMDKNDPSGGFMEKMNYVNALFDELAKELPEVSIFDSRNYPLYDPTAADYGMLRADLIHYRGEANDWVASCILSDYIEKNNIA